MVLRRIDQLPFQIWPTILLFILVLLVHKILDQVIQVVVSITHFGKNKSGISIQQSCSPTFSASI